MADDNGVVYGDSIIAAQQGIAQVTLSRIFMACPGEQRLVSIWIALLTRGSFKVWCWHLLWWTSLRTRRQSWNAIAGPTHRFKFSSVVCVSLSLHRCVVLCSRKRLRSLSTAWNWKSVTKSANKTPVAQLSPTTRVCKSRAEAFDSSSCFVFTQSWVSFNSHLQKRVWLAPLKCNNDNNVFTWCQLLSVKFNYFLKLYDSTKALFFESKFIFLFTLLQLLFLFLAIKVYFFNLLSCYSYAFQRAFQFQ